MKTYFIRLQVGNTMVWFKSVANSAREAVAEWEQLTNRAGMVCGIYLNGESVTWND